MEKILISLTQNSDILSVLMTVLTVLMTLLAVYSLLTTRKMFKDRKKAEILYIESLLRNEDFIKYIRNSDKSKFLVEIHPKHNFVVLNGEDVFVHVFENLDKKVQKQIEPALFQKNIKNRKAYLEKVAHEAKKSINIVESHC